MGGGAWPFLVGGVICLVDSVNERRLNLLLVVPFPNGEGCWSVRSSVASVGAFTLSLSGGDFLEGHSASVF